MSVDIKLEYGVKGYKVIRKQCPHCKEAYFLFRLAENDVYDVLGDGFNYPEEKVVRCKVCMSTFKYEVTSRKVHVGHI